MQILLAVRALATSDELEAGDQHRIRNVVRNPNGEQIGEGTAEVEIGGSAARPDFLVGITLPMGLQFDAVDEGTYSIEVGIDEASRALPIHVVFAAQT